MSHQFSVLWVGSGPGKSAIVCRHETCPRKGAILVEGGPHTLDQINRALWNHIRAQADDSLVLFPAEPAEVYDAKLSRRFSTAALIVAIVTGAFGVTGFMFSITALFGGH